MLRRVTITAIAALTAIGVLASPASASHYPATVVDQLVERSGGGSLDGNRRDYDILVQAVLATGLDSVLGDPNADFTVFAPNDEAFFRLVKQLTGRRPATEQAAFDTVASLGLETVAEVLKYHVAAGYYGPLRVLFGGPIPMVNGGSIEFRNGRLADADPDFVDPALDIFNLNREAGNGVVHTITQVLLPVDL